VVSPTYVRAEWIHDQRGRAAIHLFRAGRRRVRAKEDGVFKDGSIGKASTDNPEAGSTALADVPYPSIEEINAQEEFHAEEISVAEFEDLWKSSG
jgi:hypothetical protein